MEIKQKRNSSITLFFLKYLMGFSLAIIILAIVTVFSLSLAINNGIVLPANYTEQEIIRLKDTLSSSSEFKKELIPFTSTYAILSKEGIILETNMSNRTLSILKDSIDRDDNLPKNKYYIIDRDDGSRIIIRYDINAHFANPQLHKLFPKPEVLLLGFSVLGTVIIGIVIAYRFSKRLKTELAPLNEATEYIQNRELDFVIKSSKIREINEVLESLNRLKSSLASSLNEQWQIERNKKSQISAIAHDLKTPLTIIKGNSELLLESDLNENDVELLNYIQRSSVRIEEYIKILMDVSSSYTSDNLNLKEFNPKDLVYEIEIDAKAMCKTKNLIFDLVESNLPKSFYGDRMLIFRAISNVISNAAEYSRENDTITMEVKSLKSNGMAFTIIDRGYGFSPEELKYATTEFYTSQKERSGKHYGLGLYMAKKAAEKHGGNINIVNNENFNGATVSIEFYSCNNA